MPLDFLKGRKMLISVEMAQTFIEREGGGRGHGQCCESKESGDTLDLWLCLQ